MVGASREMKHKQKQIDSPQKGATSSYRNNNLTPETSTSKAWPWSTHPTRMSLSFPFTLQKGIINTHMSSEVFFLTRIRKLKPPVLHLVCVKRDKSVPVSCSECTSGLLPSTSYTISLSVTRPLYPGNEELCSSPFGKGSVSLL